VNHIEQVGRRSDAVSTRREFCVRAGETVSAAMIASLLQACGGSATSPTSGAPSLPVVGGSVGTGVLSVTVDSGSPLASVGGAVLVQSTAGNFLVARTAQDSFVALTAICTHQGCTITGFENSRYVCPCHGSQYSTSGQVVMGPATIALRQFSTQFANNVLTISI
jgi:cytochrome b6-f complex iron-sulfur subunit